MSLIANKRDNSGEHTENQHADFSVRLPDNREGKSEKETFILPLKGFKYFLVLNQRGHRKIITTQNAYPQFTYRYKRNSVF